MEYSYSDPKSDKVLFKSPWFKLLATKDNYEYMLQRPGIGILPYKANEYGEIFFLIRFELNPVYKEKAITLVTGRIDKGETFDICALRELREEAGIIGNPENLELIGKLRGNKSMFTLERIYIIDVTDAEYTEIVGDGSISEKESINKWVSFNELSNYTNQSDDAYLNFVYAKLCINGFI